MSEQTPTVVSLFSGAGGLDLGLEEAGFQVVSALDFDADCVGTLRHTQQAAIPVRGRPGHAYLTDTTIFRAAIEDMSPGALRPPGADSSWRPDLVAGGPPCQPFSSSGKRRGLDDPRGVLFRSFVDVVDALRPRLILFENVRGLVTAGGPNGKPGEALALVREAFERVGYATTVALLNAADFGVPQRRVRLFILGSRDVSLPRFPTPTHAASVLPEFDDRLPWVTLGELLAGRPSPDSADIVTPSEALAAALADVPAGSGLKSPGPRETTRPGGHWGYKQGTFIADLTKPARTVTAASTQDWIRLPDGSLRRLTWREAAALQGFPDDWKFAGGRASRYRQIGNAVPSRLGFVLGASLMQALAQSSSDGVPSSRPLPENIRAAIDYTIRDQARNGASRRTAREVLTRPNADLRAAKGLGSAEIDLGLVSAS